MSRVYVKQLKGIDKEVYSYFFQLGKKLKQEELEAIRSDLRHDNCFDVLDHWMEKFSIDSGDYRINRFELAEIEDRPIIVGYKTGRKLLWVVQLNDNKQEVARYRGTKAAARAHSTAIGANSTIASACNKGYKRYGFYWVYDGECE